MRYSNTHFSEKHDSGSTKKVKETRQNKLKRPFCHLSFHHRIRGENEKEFPLELFLQDTLAHQSEDFKVQKEEISMMLFGFTLPGTINENRGTKGLLILTITLLCFGGSYAQTWESIFEEANDTAVFNNGKIVSLEQTIPNVGTKVFSFSHFPGGKFVMTDNSGMEIEVHLREDGGISQILMPNTDTYVFQWQQDSATKWVAGNLSCNGNLIEAPDGNPCRDAVVAASIALGVCVAAPGSPACWAATANAAYHTYRCWEASQLASVRGVRPKIHTSLPKRWKHPFFRDERFDLGKI